MQEPIRIVDVIIYKNKYSFQNFLIIDRLPNFLFERKDNWLIAEDSGLYSFYYHRPHDKYAKAFAGRKFKIPLKDGGIVNAEGQWWHGIPQDYQYLLSFGVSTVEELQKCYVFTGMSVNKEIIDSNLLINPSNNYRKYDKKDKTYKKHIIVSPW